MSIGFKVTYFFLQTTFWAFDPMITAGSPFGRVSIGWSGNIVKIVYIGD